MLLDEAGPQEAARDDPELFLQRYRPPLLVDEVQHAPGLLRAIKASLERRPGAGSYWLTGSSHVLLMREVSELLSVFGRIVRGSFPVFTQPEAPPVENWYGSYVQTYLERDVRSLLRVADLAAFRRFMRLAAARIGQLVNYSDLARDTGIAVSTAREWMSVLAETFQVVLLQPYYRNLSKRQIKTPKLHFLDTGLACYLTGWRSPETAAGGAMAGALLEGYVVSEIVKSYWHRGRQAPVWFFRTKEGAEVDVVLEEDGHLFPVEVKLISDN